VRTLGASRLAKQEEGELRSGSYDKAGATGDSSGGHIVPRQILESLGGVEC